MKYLPLALIIILGLILRFIFLGQIPLSMHRDEAFFAYNAYSILKTGSDISGQLLPLHLESFFMSPAGYSYFAVPFIFIFGLSDMAARIPSALFGVLTIPLIYFLTLNLFNKNKNNHILGLVSAFLIAISPWHINLSRVATENILVTFFIMLAILLYLNFVNTQKIIFIIASFVSFGITLLLYQAPRAFLPLFIPVMFLLFKTPKSFIKIKIEYVLFIVVIILPVILILLSPELSWRITSLSIFNHSETKLVLNEQLTTDSVQGLPYIISRIFHNKLVAFGFLISENFFKHLSFDFLFLDAGFPDRYRIPHMGLLHIFELPLLLAGIFFMFKKYIKIGVFLVSWIILGIFGASLTSDDIPNLQRIVIILPALILFSSYGALSIYEFILNKKLIIRYVFLVLIFFVVIFSVSYYLVQYYFQGKVYRTWYRQDGYEQMVDVVNKLLPNYDHVLITDRESTPAVFFMYYGKYDPKVLQEETKELDMMGAGDIPFGKYRFSKEECPVRYEINQMGENILVGEKNILYVNSGLCELLPKEAKIIETIKRADNSTAFIILEL